MRKLVLFIFLLFTGLESYAQEIWMHPNAGQWDQRIKYKVELSMGEMMIEEDGFTYYLSDVKEKAGHSHDDDAHEHSELIKAHVIKSKFLGSDWKGNAIKLDSSTFYRNYILGNDPSQWKGRLFSYSRLSMLDFYPGIHLNLDGTKGSLKYSLEVEPGMEASQIQMAYEGQDKLFLDRAGRLHITNRFGEITEETPEAWLKESGANVEVKFKIEGNRVSFEFPNGYDSNETLIIDPSLTFSTFTGSTADNWGMTATPDVNGNLFGGGTVFGLGYPITVGAFDTTPNGGTVDVGLTKFTSDGTALIFSTYIGGSGDETANSMVCDQNGELYIFGLTSSANFPMAGTPYDNSYNGGPNVQSYSNGLGFSGGTDLYVLRLSADGSSLIASTYVGGSNTDGLNHSTALKYNYGDQFRGEIILDENGFVYVSSTTRSSDFPTQFGTQGALSGQQDAVLFKMPPLLNSMVWSTYFGGSGDESGNSVQIADNGDVFIAGGTTSSSMPFNLGLDQTFDGVSDGYLARFGGASGNVISGTYIGLNEYDQAYFVQLDVDDNVYVLGQTESNLGITSGHYGNGNSGQFVQKYNHNLTSLEWKTMIGGSSGHVEMSPTAFLVSDCYDIYLSGWGGDLNVLYGQAAFSSVSGFPVTPGAWQGTTSGDNFYIGVLGHDALFLKYGTFFGGTNNLSDNHVDGGTSRFDKSGRIYHAVCGSCGLNINNGFTTTPGVWAETAGSQNCNLAAFKFELNTIEALVTTPNPVVCIPDPVIFNNNSANGNTFFWDFGDGNYSNDVNPTHVYGSPGTYTITVVASDSNQCYTPDTVQFVVDIGDFNGGIVQPSGPICPGDSYQLEAYGGVDYSWTPAQYLDDPNISNPLATLDQTTDFTVVITDSCGIDTAYITVEVLSPVGGASGDTSVCVGNSVTLSAIGGGSYEWSPPDFLDDHFSANPVSSPSNDIEYIVNITTPEGCVIQDSVLIEVFYTPPAPVMPDVVEICENAAEEITVSGASTYIWYPNSDISAIDTNVVVVNPPTDTWYYCDFINACGIETDSVFIDVIIPEIIAGTDTIICPGETAVLWAEGGVSYSWTPATVVSPASGSLVNATPVTSTMYVVTGTDQFGCSAQDSVFVDLFPQPFIQTNPDVHAFIGDEVQLSATSSTSGQYTWYPEEFLSCVNCTAPVATPDENFTYYVTYTDENGCSASDNVTIYYDPILYIPNTFTPGDGDAHNSVFQVKGGNILEFEMLIFNRWGELIYTMTDIYDSWDGTYNGVLCQDGTYVWKVTYAGYDEIDHQLTGHVNLLK